VTATEGEGRSFKEELACTLGRTHKKEGGGVRGVILARPEIPEARGILGTLNIPWEGSFGKGHSSLIPGETGKGKETKH